jgi:Tannase and feruloyl esterase
MQLRTGAGFVVAALLSSCATPQLGTDSRGACVTLKGTLPPSVVGMPSGVVTIESSTLMQPSAIAVADRGPTPAATITPAAPEYCKVLGSIAPVDPAAPPIQFQVNLPITWNGRSVQYGGGGFNGTLITGLALKAL